MEQDSIFLSYVRYVFKKWVGFREALLQGMGGVYAKEKEQWMGNEIENYFKSYSARVRPEDIEKYLGTMLENEFDTYFEDGSLQEISVKFCEAYPLSLTNPDAEIFQEMKNSVNVASNHNSSANNFNQENDEETACKRMEQLKVTENSDDDGWTTVGKRNRNK
ncbi:uncharacterized protein TNCV_2349391 [Trichonephila clavipes]|uniref:Pre-rRNA-processing protein TSR2 homolog n=1 Tax=Trichonephila clavipes TaxID=2585209 RepID=A0A8X6VKK5_TRICX|nr:uncharacterized protein TNCV_2349391 [Trichonephila clavipes]